MGEFVNGSSEPYASKGCRRTIEGLDRKRKIAECVHGDINWVIIPIRCHYMNRHSNNNWRDVVSNLYVTEVCLVFIPLLSKVVDRVGVSDKCGHGVLDEIPN